MAQGFTLREVAPADVKVGDAIWVQPPGGKARFVLVVDHVYEFGDGKPPILAGDLATFKQPRKTRAARKTFVANPTFFGLKRFQ